MSRSISNLGARVAVSAACLVGLMVACGRVPQTAQKVDAAPAATVAPPVAPALPTGAEPALESMGRAALAGKRGAPVDVRFRVDGEVAANTPIPLQLALVPRVAGSNLQYEVEGSPDIQVSAKGSMAAQKAAASEVYRQTLSITPQRAAVTEVRVLVSMETAEGLAFGVYRIPLQSATSAGKSLENRKRYE